MARAVEMFCPTPQSIYFSREIWTSQISLNSFKKIERGCQALTVATSRRKSRTNTL
jgi:hypothetical protein